MILFVLACAPSEPAVDDGITLLTRRERLIRLSVDLRGVHPSEADLVAVEQNPDLYPSFADRWLEDERFLDRAEELVNLRFLTRNGDTYFDPSEAGVLASDHAVATAIAEEPLRLVRDIVATGRPWTELVTAETTRADPLLAALWDLEYPEGGEGWQEARYRDGRPMAGVLSMNTLWLRYPSMGGNANRHRANAVSRLLLCDDYLSRPIVLGRSNIDQLVEDPEVAIQNEACQSCHSSLDPLAAHFYGFFHPEGAEDLIDARTYLPENEEGWRDYADKSPAYYGRPTASLAELGAAIAADPRFTDCAVRTFWEGLTQRSYSDVDWSEVQAAEAAFLDAGLAVKPMVKAIVTSRAYLAAAVEDDDADARIATVRTVSPAQMASIVEDLTGYRWTFDGVDGLTDPANGLVVLAGGVDGGYVSAPSYSPSVGSAFVLERLAEAAALDVCAHDLDPGRTDDARLLALVTAETTPDSDPTRFDAQVRALYLRVTGLALAEDAEEPALLATLWKQVYSVEASGERAWAAVVAAALRDPRVLFY